MKFTSAEQAVRFSFNISERAEYSRMDLFRVRGTGEDSLSPTDLHAQAAMIHNHVNRLGVAERTSVLAMYGKGRDRAQAIRELADYLWPSLCESVPDKRTLQIILCHWATRRPSIRAIAAELGVSYRKVCDWRGSVLRAWMPLQLRAIHALHDSLFTAGGFELEQ